MKKIVSLVLALSMVLSMFTSVFAGTTLTDVADTEYEAAVSALVELGIVSGYEDGTYLPNKVVSRAEMAKLLVISAGLEGAADVAKGTTRFSDVAANHWAAGYINVAAEYGYINGYPEGTFKPEETVTYSEAVTMAIRVLGYKSVVEDKGTWPTNYIAKATELGVLKKISYNSYNDGATRGNVASLIWNILRTNMWDVNSENESNGLNYTKMGTMIDKYFEDYTYATVDFVDYRIDEGKVLVSLDDHAAANEVILEHSEYEYLANDFYTFVEDTEVEVLVNEEDETLLMMVITSDNKLVEGKIEDLEEDKYTNLPVSGDYVFASYTKKALNNTSVLEIANTYVEKVAVKDDYIKVNGSTLKNSLGDADLFEDEVVIKDGERASIEDLEVGDVLTKVTNVTAPSGDTEIFYVIGSAEVEGKLTKYVVDKDTSVGTITVDGKEYTLDNNAKYVVDPEDEDEDATLFRTSSEWEEMKNEEIVAICDALLGKVIRIEFDGNLDDDDDSATGAFYAITGNVERASSRTYTIELENENGKDEYTFDDVTLGSALYKSGDDLVGQYAYVELNDDGEVTSIKVILTYANHTPVSGEIVYGDVSGEKYVLTHVASAEYDKEENGLLPCTELANGIEVTDDVVVVTLVKDDKGTDKSGDDEYSITFVEGLEAIENLDDEEVVVIYDFDADFFEAKYIVLFDEISTKSDIKAGIVEGFELNKLNKWEIEVDTADGVEIAVVEDSGDFSGEALEVVAYKTEEDDDEVVFTFVAGLTSGELSLSGDATHGYVVEANGRKAKVEYKSGDATVTTTVNLGNKTTTEDYEDCVIVLVEVSEGSNFLVDGAFEVDNVEVIDYEDVRFQKYDRISGEPTDDVVFIIRGMEERA